MCRRDIQNVCRHNVGRVSIKHHIVTVSHPTIDKSFQELMTVKKQEYYERLFEPYPDVVTLDEFRAMLGGIGETAARKILHGNHIKHFFIRRTYRIPKVWVIEYVLSDHYAKYRQELKVQI